MAGRIPTRSEHDKSRLDLAERLARAENITFSEAVRRIPNDPAALRDLISRLNDPQATRARETARNARESGESFSEAAHRSR